MPHGLKLESEPTVSARRLALARALVGGAAPPTFGPIERREENMRGAAPLSFAQERLWFLDRWNPGSATYNVPIFCRLLGGLDVEALIFSLQSMVERHEVLRTAFPVVDGRPMQVVHFKWHLPVDIIDLSTLPAEERARESTRLIRDAAGLPFDLANGPVIRTSLV